MYKIIGREIYGKGRKGRYIVKFTRHWPQYAKNIYLIGEFTSLYPGFVKLRKIEEQGIVYLKLWPGEYGYGFQIDNDFENILDPDNEEKKCVHTSFFPEYKKCLSKLVIKEPDNPLDKIIHIEESGFIHKFNDEIIIRLIAPTEINEPLIDLGNEIREPLTKHVVGDNIVYQYIIPSRSILRYRFIFNYNDKKLFYGDEGVSENSSYIVVNTKYIPGVDKPRWYMGTVYYQIFIDSFDNGDPNNDPPNRIKKTVPREYGYYGGDLAGIMKHIDHLEDLGVETIYLTPIFSSTSYHRYDTIDYKSIDKYLGTMEDFEKLVQGLHSRKIKIVLDITMHHTNPCNKLFVKALREGENSPYWEMFSFLSPPPKEIVELMLKYIDGEECRSRELYKLDYFRNNKPFYEAFFNIWLMAKFNHDNPRTVDYFIDITKFWIDKGIDGFRIDVAMGIHYSWMKQYYEYIKNTYPDFLVLGELAENPRIYMDYFDSAMNYYLRKAILELLIYKRIDLNEFISRINNVYEYIPHYKALSLYNMLGSHDVPRIKSMVQNNKLLKLMYVLIFALPGSPVIYYGDEIGLEGGRDPDNRRPMIWDRGNWDLELYEHIKKLIRIYKSCRSIRHGYFLVENLGSNLLFIKRWINNEEIIFLLNVSSKDISVDLKKLGKYSFDIYNEKNIDQHVENNVLLRGYGFLILGSKPCNI